MSESATPPGTMSRAITRLLIANRGEIAVRIARTAHRLGISTVGVYSEPDADAMHVDAVDVAVALGGSTPAESYLRADAIIEAKGLTQISDSGALEAIVDQVLAAGAKLAGDYRGGNVKAFNALVGQVMKASQGKANPAQAAAILKKKLD